MIDLRLFRKPAFTGAQIGGVRDLGLALRDVPLPDALHAEVLGYSPLQAGLRFLPISLLAFVAAPIGGKLSASVPVRAADGRRARALSRSRWR